MGLTPVVSTACSWSTMPTMLVSLADTSAISAGVISSRASRHRRRMSSWLSAAICVLWNVGRDLGRDGFAAASESESDALLGVRALVLIRLYTSLVDCPTYVKVRDCFS